MMLGKVNDRYRSFQESFVIFLSSFNFCLFIFLVYQSTQDMAYRPTTGSGVSSHHRMWRTVPPQDLVFHPNIGCGVPSHHRIWCIIPPFDVAYRPTTGYYLSGVLPSGMAGAQQSIFISMVSYHRIWRSHHRMFFYWMWCTVPPQDLIFMVSYHRVWQGPNTAYLSLWCPTIEYGGPTTGYLSLPFLLWRNCKNDCFV